MQLALVAFTSGVLAAAVASASNPSAGAFHARPLVRAFAVLRAPRIADAASAPAEPLAGATTTVLAADNSDGSRLFVATQADGDICIIDQEPQSATPDATGAVRTGLMDVGCSPAAAAEQQGGVLTFPATATLPAVAAALVPSGVTHVDFVLTDGTDVPVAVVNNVAWYSSPQLASVQFAVPGGQDVTAGTTPVAPTSQGT
jgi:hypothetical protein